MTYDARQIVNWFIERAQSEGRTLSIMSLLKLAYIAHGWRLEMTQDPLFNNRIEAWKLGPVVPEVYSGFRPQGVVPQKTLSQFPPPTDPSDIDFLDQIYKIYGHMPPFKLSDLTHVPGGPWETAREWGGDRAEIPNDLIRSHYIAKRQTANAANVR